MIDIPPDPGNHNLYSRRNKRWQPRRDTILISVKGVAPRPAPAPVKEKDRNWRPSTYKF